MWLNALSLSTPHLVLEDDVQLLPGADLWYLYALRAFASDSRIVAASFQKQTLVNQHGYAGKRERPWPPVTWSLPYLYPLPGSHGFLISPLHVDSFRAFVATRKPSALLLDGLTTTGERGVRVERAAGVQNRNSRNL